MKSLSKILLGLVVLSSQIGLRAMNTESEPGLTAPNLTEEQQPNVTSSSQKYVDPQTLVNTIDTIVDVVENADNILDQIIPDSSPGTDDQTVNVLSQDELMKWKYVNNYFTKNLDISSTPQKAFQFIDKYASFLSMPTTIIYILLTDSALTGLKSIFAAPADTQKTKSEPAANAEAPSASASVLVNTLNLGAGSIKYITAPIIGGLITYKILKYVSAKVMKKAERCNTVLISFAKDWETHKSQTPDVLCSFFEHLNQELIKNNGKLPKVDALLAQNMVEGIISTSSIFASIEQ